MAIASEIRLGRKAETPTSLLIKGLVALTVLYVVLFLLPGCDNEFYRLQSEAEFNAKLARAATPKDGELVTIRQLGTDRFIVRKYEGGLKETYVIAREEAE